MKATTIPALVMGLSGMVSWFIVFRYRKAWGQELGPFLICKRLMQEAKAWGWALILSQAIGLVAVAYLFYLINVK